MINLHFWYLRWSGWQEPIDYRGVEGVWMAVSKTSQKWLEVRKRLPGAGLVTRRPSLLAAESENMKQSLIETLCSGHAFDQVPS